MPRLPWFRLHSYPAPKTIREHAFRRRTKTQAAFTNEDSALVLLYGLFAMEQITLRKIDGWKDLKEVQLPGLQHAA